MVFKCQENSFLKEFTTKVISCEKSTFTLNSKELTGYNIILEDTILFPEGGGQPCDYGEINNKFVWNVVRNGSDAVHFVETNVPFQFGDVIEQKLNWKRRLDHMQQHSGQHLITALFDKEYGYDTKSWNLGNDISYIQLDTHGETITKEQVNNIEVKANDLIIEGKSVNVIVTTKNDFFKLPDIRAPRGLPADHEGPIRVITIDGIESNMCCGTHVSNLSQLQSIKLLNIEKTKNKILLSFLVGQRVIKKLDECYNREVQLTNIIKNGPNSHIDLIIKLQNNYKVMQKSIQKALRDLAVFEADKIKNILENTAKLPKYYSVHRSEGIEPDFINTFLRNAPDDLFYFLTVSELNGKTGQMVLKGLSDQNELLEKLGNKFMELLDGKGNLTGSQYQGKFNNVKKLSECEKILYDYFNENKE